MASYYPRNSRSCGICYSKRGQFFADKFGLYVLQAGIIYFCSCWGSIAGWRDGADCLCCVFIDPCCALFAILCCKWQKEGKPMKEFVNYAHRGASEYAPENTLLSFYLGLTMGANGIETDIHVTKDGVAVLFHDDTLERVTGVSGCVEDYTFCQLQCIYVKKNALYDRIPSFEDFLQHFAFRKLTFAIELKQSDVVKETADLIRRYGIEKKTVVTSFKYEELLKMRRYAPELETGYLTADVTDTVLQDMKEQGITELCPKADSITPACVDYWHSLGFRVRAWGVADENLMKNAYDSGVDGMTVNFPDKLAAYMKEKSNG